MLVFLIAVKHPARSRSYERVTDLLRRTLASIEAQTDDNFAVIVVCNKCPAWAKAEKKRLFIEVDFPPAALPSSLNEEHSWTYIDKGAKMAVGLLHARQFAPTHIMFADADDFVSRRLAEHVRLNPDAPGWYFERGLLYSGQFKIAEEREKFWSYCGTSHILRYDLLPLDLDAGAAVSLEGVLGSLDRFFVERILGNHLDFAAHVAKRGLRLLPLPFIGAVWHADTGENSSRFWWGHSRFGSIWGQRLTPEQALEFTIPPTPRRLLDTLLLYAWRARFLAAGAVRSLLRRPRRSE